MKRSLGMVLLISFGLLVIASQSNSPQSPVEISGEPRHHPKFENEFVRVWDVTVPAGDATLWHAHRNDNVVVTLAGAKLRLETAGGGAPAEAEWKFGDVKFGKATYVHRAMNIGATSFHNFTIELLKATAISEPGRPSPDNPRVPVLDNDRVRVYRVSLEPGQSTGMHTHFLPSLAVAITAADLEATSEGKASADRLTVPAGDVRWRGGALTHSIKNVGKTRYEGADIEIK